MRLNRIYVYITIINIIDIYVVRYNECHASNIYENS